MAEPFKEVIQLAFETLGAGDAQKLADVLRGIGAAGGDANEKLAPLINELESLAAQSAKVSEAIDISQKITANNAALADAKKALSDLNEEFSRTDKSSADVSTAFSQAEKRVKSLAAEQLKLQTASASTNDALKASGVDTTNLGAANDALKAKAAGVADKIRETATAAAASSKSLKDTADSTKKAGKEAGKAGGLFKELKDHLGEILSVAAAVELALKGIEFGKESFTEAAALEQSLSRVSALAQGAQQNVAQYEEAIQSAGEEAGTSALKAAEGMAALVQQGRSADEAILALVPTLRLAKIAQIDVAQAAQLVDGALSQFGLGAEHAGEVVDLLVASSKGAKDGLLGLAEGVGKVAPLARDLNLSLNDTVGILAFMTKNGLDAGTATKGLSSIFSDLRDPASALSQALFSLGDGSKDFSTAIATLSASGQRGKDALDNLDGSARKVVLFLLQQGPQALSQFQAGLANVGGEAERVDKLLGQNLNTALEGFERRISEIGSQLAAPILAPLRTEFETLSARLDSFAKSPAFEKIKAAIGDLATQGIAAVDNFLQGVDWQAFADGASAAISDAATSVKSFKDDLGSVAAALNEVGAVVGVVYRAIAVVFDLAKTTISGVVAAKFSELSALSSGIDKVTGTTSKLTLALESVRDSAKDAAANGLSALNTNAAKLGDNLKALGGSADATAGTFANVRFGARTVALDIAKIGDATEQTAKDLGLLKLIAPPAFQAVAAGAKQATDNAVALANAQSKVTAAANEMERLARSGDLSSTAFLAAQAAFRGATNELAKVRAEIEQNTGAADKLSRAYANLGITSQKVLQEKAQASASALDEVFNAFQRGAATIEDVRSAFARYSDDQLAAVANSDAWKQQTVKDALEVKAAILGLQGVKPPPFPTPDTAPYQQGLQNVSDANRQVIDTSTTASRAIAQGADAAKDAADHQKRLAEATDTASVAIENSSFATDNARGPLQAIQLDLSNFSRAAVKAFSDVQAASFRFGISNDADVDNLIRNINEGNRQINESIKRGQADIETFVTRYNNLSEQQLSNLIAQSGGFDGLTASIQNTANAARAGEGDFALLNDADLSRLESAAAAVAAQVQAIKDKADSAKASLADMANSFQDQIDQINGNQQDAENRQFQQTLDDLRKQAEASGVLQSQEYNDAVAKATALHDLKLRQIEQQAAKQKQADEAAASQQDRSSSSTASTATPSGNSTKGNNTTSVHTTVQKVDLDVGGGQLLSQMSDSQIIVLSQKLAGNATAIANLLRGMNQGLFNAARQSGVFGR